MAVEMETPGFFTSFVGRRDLLTDVRERLSRSRVVSLVGAGGVGKTRLALRVVELMRQSRNVRHGICFAALDDLAAKELLTSAIADAIGAQILGPAAGTDALIEHIADRQALLVLDGCEHLYREVADLVSSLRAACPRLTVLITSRRPLMISGEDVVAVPALSAPSDELPTTTLPQTLEHYESVQLFVERARAASSAFELTADNAQAVAQLCGELAGNPLALELAASRARVFTPQGILARLHDPFRVLSVGYQDAPARHRSLLTCVEWSHSLCSEAEQRLWERVWVFTGGFTLEAAAEVCRCDPSEQPGEPALIDLVGALVDQSVLLAEPGAGGSMRYRMLPDIREYGRRSAQASGNEEELRERHVRWCRELATRFGAESAGPGQEGWFARLDAELPNIRAALQHAARTPGLVEAALHILVDLDLFWVGVGHLGEAQTWHDTLLATGEGSASVRARVSASAAQWAMLRGDMVGAREQLRWAKELGGDDVIVRGRSLVVTAVLASWKGDIDTALAEAGRAIDLLGPVGDVNGLLLAHVLTGILHNLAGDPDRAEESYLTCIATAEGTGELWMRAFALSGLGDLAMRAGEIDRAEDLYRQALLVKHRLRDRTGMAVCLDALGRVAIERGRGRRAALLLGAAERLWVTVGMSHAGNVLIHTGARDTDLEPVRKALDEREFREQFGRGAQLDLAQAIEFALDPGLDDTRAAMTDATTSSPLTKRELEVADLVADGLSNPEIATRLVISVRTAQGHVENILRKLGFNSRSLIAAWVAERRLGQPPDMTA